MVSRGVGEGMGGEGDGDVEGREGSGKEGEKGDEERKESEGKVEGDRGGEGVGKSLKFISYLSIILPPLLFRSAIWRT